MRVVALPPPLELEKLLAGLLQRAVKVTAADGVELGPSAALSHYRTNDPVIEVVALCDLPLAASCAAALTLMPPNAVKEAVASGKLDASLRDNLSEVMNVLARYVSASGRRFGLVHAYGQPDVPPPALDAAARAADERRTFDVQVPGYAAGKLAFHTLD